MWRSDLWVDNTAHELHLYGRTFPCDRDVEGLLHWNDHALLLSSDTDCLSLWDREGLVRTARVGEYPQDMSLQGDTVYICGGADGRLHLLSLPELHTLTEFSIPGMPERLALFRDAAYILTLLPEPEVHTALLRLDLRTGLHEELSRYMGLPGAITADDGGLWVGVSELVIHLPHGTDAPDVVIEGIGMAREIRSVVCIMQNGITLDISEINPCLLPPEQRCEHLVASLYIPNSAFRIPH